MLSQAGHGQTGQYFPPQTNDMESIKLRFFFTE